MVLPNASRSVGFENLSLTLSDSSGDILPKELDTVVLGELMPGESLDLSFPVTVEEAVKTDTLATQETSKQKTPASVIVLSIVCAMLAAALIAQSILLRGKLHKLEEERL